MKWYDVMFFISIAMAGLCCVGALQAALQMPRDDNGSEL